MPFIKLSAAITICAMLATALMWTSDYTYVPVPGTDNIQTALISTIPTGNFTTTNSLRAPFSISSAPGHCGPSGASSCNYNDSLNAAGKTLTLNVSVPGATDVYTLMNAYLPPPGVQLSTVKFIGSAGATLTFPLIAGEDIRDYHQGPFANTLSNGVSGVEAVNYITCVDPTTCLGSGATGNVQTGRARTYVADEQHFYLGNAFVGQTLTQIVFTATANGATTAILAITVAAGAPSSTNLLTNGSFESPVVPAGSGQSFAVASTAIPGWSVVGPSGLEVYIFSGSLTISGYSFPAEDGSQALDLTGAHANNIEGVSQSVSTVQGKTYTLTFWVGNVSGGNFGIFSSVGLKINGVPAGNFTNSTAGTTLIWQKFSYSFIATSSTTAIEFDNLDPLADAVNALDNVDLEEGGTASPLPVNLVVNGDFETPIVPTGADTNFTTGSTQLPGWNIVGTATPNTIATVSGALFDSGFYAPAEDGHQWMDLTGTGYSTGTRGITQTVSTVTGTYYSLSFWVGNLYDTRNPASVPDGQNFGTTSTVGVKINGISVGKFTNTANVTILNWQQFSLTFTATDDLTPIEFDNLDPPTDTCNGLDNVVLSEIDPPTVNAVVSASDYGKLPDTAPGSQIEIYGSNLAGDTRGWSGADFTNGIAPISLDGTAVTIGGKPAFVDYISPGQVNVVVPSDVSMGLQQVTVTTAAGTSSMYDITVNALEPGFLAPAAFKIGGTQYVAAFFPDNSAALPTGAIAGLPSHPAKPGDIVTLYGIGFGPVIPNIPAGQIVQASNKLASSFEISIGGMPATVQYAGLAPNYTGLYQINVVVPNVSGNAPLTFILGGRAGTQTLYLSVEN